MCGLAWRHRTPLSQQLASVLGCRAKARPPSASELEMVHTEDPFLHTCQHVKTFAVPDIRDRNLYTFSN